MTERKAPYTVEVHAVAGGTRAPLPYPFEDDPIVITTDSHDDAVSQNRAVSDNSTDRCSATDNAAPATDADVRESLAADGKAQHVIDAVCQRLALAGVSAFDISVYRERLEALVYGIRKQ